jgi:hypothetical protein
MTVYSSFEPSKRRLQNIQLRICGQFELRAKMPLVPVTVGKGFLLPRWSHWNELPHELQTLPSSPCQTMFANIDCCVCTRYHVHGTGSSAYLESCAEQWAHFVVSVHPCVHPSLTLRGQGGLFEHLRLLCELCTERVLTTLPELVDYGGVPVQASGNARTATLLQLWWNRLLATHPSLFFVALPV